ncbi:potassium channel subfamily K member 1-like [Coregonus clupeaformis]|uniref:potassium channel subfamily K member 1-like n=1 Tax=Coregonus clupeaformis TaxID=59861 RepID=UPI001BDFF9BB|nr:potassium channel subfamily K member 1-like [Coregonus clupeaformis]
MVCWVDWFQRFCQSHAFCFLLLSYVLFTLFGGLVLMAIEQPQENKLRAQVLELREHFLRDNHCVLESRLDTIIGKVYFSANRNIAVLDTHRDDRSWDLISSMFFVINVLTVRGYGNSSTLSDDAKLFCIFYSLLGIPLTLFVLSCLSDLLLPILTHVPVRHLQTYWGLPYSQAVLLHASLFSLVLAVLLFLLPATSLCYLEPEWSFLDALFFCVVTLSTIGQGDYLLGKRRNEATKECMEFLTSCYLMAGIVAILTFQETATEVPQVQAVLQLFCGPQDREVKGTDLDEMVLSAEDSGTPLDVSPCPLEQPAPLSPDQPNPQEPDPQPILR